MMRRCDCSTLSTCEVCCPPRTESELREQIDNLKSAHKSYLDGPIHVQTNGPDPKPGDYARHYRIGVDPATKNGRDESVLLAGVFNEQGQVIAMRILNGTRRN